MCLHLALYTCCETELYVGRITNYVYIYFSIFMHALFGIMIFSSNNFMEIYYFQIFLPCNDILCKLLLNLNVFIRFYEMYDMFTDFVENRIFLYTFILKLYLNLNMSL